MKKMLSGLFLTAVLAVSASAQTRGFHQDYREIERARAEVAADRARLNEHTRRGMWRQVRADREELARDERKLDFLLRDARHDRFEYNRWR